MTVPFYKDASTTLYEGNALGVLPTLEAGSVNMCVTSPPYFGLRSYGTNPEVWGGASECQHEWNGHNHRARDNRNGKGSTQVEADVKRFHDNLRDGGGVESAFCSLCGAWRGELGLEPTPEMYVEHVVEVFRDVRRVLRDDGTLWLNLGDSYANDGKWGGSSGGKHVKELHGASGIGRGKKHTGLKPKDLIGIPWRTAFALQADGWYLRSEIIWHKPNPMPESVTDRPTKSHEQIFLLSKSPTYYYDAEAIKEPFADERMGNPGVYVKTSARERKACNDRQDLGFINNGGGWNADSSRTGRNRRSVWTVSTKPYSEAHFATFPEDLIEPCILAGCPQGGTVLDPFNGAGTSGVVARRLLCNYVGIDINISYLEMTLRRLPQESLFMTA